MRRTIGTLAGFAFAQVRFRGKDTLFVLVLLQLFILPEVLIVENYKVAANLGLLDSILGIGAPYMASAFGIFLMRQAFKSVPKELDEADAEAARDVTPEEEENKKDKV